MTQHRTKIIFTFLVTFTLTQEVFSILESDFLDEEELSDTAFSVGSQDFHYPSAEELSEEEGTELSADALLPIS